MKGNWALLIACAWILWSSTTDLKIWSETKQETGLQAVRGHTGQAECEKDKIASLYVWIKEYRAPGRGGATEPTGNRVIVYDKPNDAINGKVVRFDCWPSDFDPRGKQ